MSMEEYASLLPQAAVRRKLCTLLKGLNPSIMLMIKWLLSAYASRSENNTGLYCFNAIRLHRFDRVSERDRR